MTRFLCPQCGSTEFGTSTDRDGVRTISCHGDGCTFSGLMAPDEAERMKTVSLSDFLKEQREEADRRYEAARVARDDRAFLDAAFLAALPAVILDSKHWATEYKTTGDRVEAAWVVAREALAQRRGKFVQEALQVEPS